MKPYCIYVLAHRNALVFDKVLFHLEKHSTPGIKKFIVLNNPSVEVEAIAKKYGRAFHLYYYYGENISGRAMDAFISENKFPFYFKIDDDVIVETPFWDKRLFITWKNNSEKTGFVSCMVPLNCFNWSQCLEILKLNSEFSTLFNYSLPDAQNHIVSEESHKQYITDLSRDLKVKIPEEFKSFSKSYYSSPIWFDKNAALWLWKKVLEKKLKPVPKIIFCTDERYSISLIGFSSAFWEESSGFGDDDEYNFNLQCRRAEKEILLDYSVIAHHFSYALHFDFLKENLYPLIKDKEF